jgi:hypothetical protein
MSNRTVNGKTLGQLALAAALVLLAGSTSMAGTIADARAATIGTTLDVTNVVVTSVVDTISSTSSATLYVQDSTGGATVYGTTALITALLTDVTPGSQITLTGVKTATYNGLFELNVLATTTKTVIAQPGVPAAQQLTAADLADSSANAETYESMLVKIQNGTTGLVFKDSTGADLAAGATFAGLTNYRLVEYGGTSYCVVRIPTSSIELVGKVIPTVPVNVTGLITQFDSASPYTEGYQLYPRGQQDIQYIGNAPPAADTQSVTANKGGTAVTITLSGSDPDSAPSPLAYQITSTANPHRVFPTEDTGALGGTIKDAVTNADLTSGGSLSSGNNQVIFTPSATNSGWFTFKFKTYDGSDLSNEATVNIFVQDTGRAVITEIMYDPANIADNDWEWVEVKNLTASDITLHTLFDAQLKNTATIEGNVSGQILPANATKVITADTNTSRSTQAFVDEWGIQASDLLLVYTGTGRTMPALGNSGDSVYLFASDGSLLDSVTYQVGTNDWPAANNRGSIFLEYGQFSTTANDSAANWRLSVPGVGGAHATAETMGPPSDSDAGSPAVLPTTTTTAATSPIAVDTTVEAKMGGGVVTITLQGTDAAGAALAGPPTATYTVTSNVAGFAPTTGTGGTMVDPNNSYAAVTAGTALAGTQIIFTPTKSGRYYLQFKVTYNGVDSGYGYVTILVQGAQNQVIMSEIMFNPSGTEPQWEYVELVNLTANDITLHSLLDTYSAASTTDVSVGNLVGITIPANSVKVLTPLAADKTLETFVAAWDPLASSLVSTVTFASNNQVWRGLNNDGDSVYLYAADGSLLDTVKYTTSSPWPTSVTNTSIYLTQNTDGSWPDNDTGSNWAKSVSGTANARATVATVTDVGSPGMRPNDLPEATLIFDFNDDGAVDIESDLPVFVACAAGPAIAHDGTTNCQKADWDDDGDVDSADFAKFQMCLQASGATALSDCLR